MKAAAVYAKRLGWSVIPIHSVDAAGACSCQEGAACRSPGKHPRVREWEKQATSDPETIAGWIERWPSTNVGIATGSTSGFFVLDVDPDHGGDTTIAEIEAEHGELPVTPTARTGSGGRHFLFQLPDFAVTNKAGRFAGEAFPGLDIRGDGGQIVVAPSVSRKGPYKWIRPPWSTPLAPAPEWLLDLLRRSATAPGVEVETERPDFPPASPEVLEQARQALERHGPGPDRINGEGGGQHAVQAGAILMRDFALTEDEAWPLLDAWNETRDTPFDEDDLRVRLLRGLKYGKSPFGAKRTLDAFDSALKLITDWQRVGGGQPTMFSMISDVRKVAARVDDPAKRAVIQRELQGATGLGVRDLALPTVHVPAEAEEIPAGSIMITHEVHQMADDATRAIAPHVFQRNGVLCEVATGGRTFLSDLETARVRDLMSRSAKWLRTDPKAGLVAMAPPIDVAAIVHARRTHEKIRVIEAVTTAPIFLSDGTILQTRGYNGAVRVFLEPSVTVNVPDSPDRAVARDAVLLLKDLVSDFKFATHADFSVWLAALLTPLTKASIRNAPAPLFCMSASTPGAGKSLLSEILALIVTGEPAETRSYNPKDPAEWGKRITAFVKSGAPLNVFDNVNGEFGPDEVVDRLITSTVWSDRILGASEAPPLPIVGTWIANGNNISPRGDTVRRSAICRIEVDTERPQERTGFKYERIKRHVAEHRAEYLTAALTILRAWHVAGRPQPKIPNWGSFEDWSDVVRAALVWTGLPDPFLTQQRAALELGEPDGEAHEFWISVVEGSPGDAASIVTTANQRGAAALLNLNRDLTTYALRAVIGRWVDRVRGGKRIRREIDPAKHQARYFVEVV